MGKYLDLAKSVVTASFCGKATPVTPEPGLATSDPPRHEKSAGPAKFEPDRQYERNELYEKRVGSDLAVCPPGGRAVLLQFPDSVPEAWAQGVADLLAAPPHRGWTEERWKILEDDALAFLKTWAAQAHALGWSALDLFSVHGTASRVRHDAKGLVPLLDGRPVVALSEDSAVITAESGATHTFRKRQAWPVGCCLVWELADRNPLDAGGQ